MNFSSARGRRLEGGGCGKPRQGGFTLFELLVALTIAGAALAVLFRGVSENLASLTVTAHYENAISRCKSHLAAIGRSTALTPGDSTGDDGGGYRWQLGIDPVASAISPATPPGTSATAALFHIHVGISWLQDGKRREVSLNTFRVEPLGQT